MQVAVRSYFTAGVAVAGVAALIAAPISPTPTDIRVPAIYSAQVNLAAASNPITPWIEVIDGAVTNVVGIGSALAADPVPAIRQLITNLLANGETLVHGLTGAGSALFTYATETVPASLRTALQDLTQGNVTGAAQTISDMFLGVLVAGFALIDVVAIPGQMADTFARVVNAVAGFGTLLPLVIGAIGPVISVINALGAQGQAVVDSFGAGDPLGALSAIVNTPAALTGALLNGFADAPGLLTFDPITGANGLLGALLVTIPRAIADALKPPAPLTQTQEVTSDLGAAALPDPNAVAVTLDTTVDASKTAVEPASQESQPAEVVAEEAAVDEAVVDEAAVGEVTEEAVAEELEEAEEAEEPAVTIRVAPRGARTSVKRAGNPSAA